MTTLVALTPDVERAHADAFASFDPEFDDGDLGLGPLSDEMGDAVALVGRLVDDPGLTHRALAAQLGIPEARIGRAVKLVRCEATRQGLAPARHCPVP